MYFSQAIIWDKLHPVLTRKDFMGAHEWAFYGWKEGAGHKFYGPNNATDLWHVKKIPPQQLEHLTGKPAELAIRAMQYSSVQGENVLDLFGGSGSTLIAAEQTGRKALLMELDATISPHSSTSSKNCCSMSLPPVAWCDMSSNAFLARRECSHYSIFRLAGPLPTPTRAREEYESWAHRLLPRRFALLGGEPLLNPNLIEHLRLARECWPASNLMLVTNGFFFDRHPELPKTLVETDCRLEVSQHGTHPGYLERFRKAKHTVWKWREDHPGIQIKIRQSHRGWMRQYRVETGKPMPFNSAPNVAFKICMQKTCTQLFQNCLWKCPALAYHALMEKRLRLESVPAWQLFRDYKACPAFAADNELRTFVETKAIPQCGLCPSKRVPFNHSDPTLANSRHAAPNGSTVCNSDRPWESES